MSYDNTVEGRVPKIDGNDNLLKMNDVMTLPNDVDSIVHSLKTVDYSLQDLDVLIELSKQLKYKRLGLFPDTNYLLTLQEASLPL